LIASFAAKVAAGPPEDQSGSPAKANLSVYHGTIIVVQLEGYAVTKKPFFREFDGCWYAQVRVGGKRKQVKHRDLSDNPIRGQDNDAAAWKSFHRLMAEDPANLPAPSLLKVAQVCDLFLSHAERHNEPKTFTWYQKFCIRSANTPCSAW
jgi:hypothetical protein